MGKPVINVSYCCSKCGKCFIKTDLKTKMFKENKQVIIEYYCPKCNGLLAREIISL